MFVELNCCGAISVDFVLFHPELFSGLVVCALGLGGLDPDGIPSEDASFQILDDFKAQKDIEKIVRTNAKLWGNGPTTEEGRADARTREWLYKWCKDIAAREVAGRGGGALPSEGLSDKTIVALGRHDESSTNATMRYVAEHVHKAELIEFKAAHMTNLECPKEFNEWLGAFLDRFMQ